jgi:signal transduction histidine kinase/ActR/RegA family two-component response regulator
MPPPSIPDADARIILLPATQRDGEVTSALLARSGLNCQVFAGPREAAVEMRRGVGVVVMTEDVFLSPGLRDILELFERQPAWSEIPVVVLMHGAGGSPGAARMLQALRNVTLLERPAPMRSVLSAVQAALRARQRQYEIRDQLETIRQAQARAGQLQGALEELLRSEQAARISAERASQMKDEFLATLSHELRTPLSAIVGWSHLLSRPDMQNPEVLREGLAVIDRNARAQTQLIEDLLDMNRIISGKIRLEIGPVAPALFIEEAIETVKPAADARNITIHKALDLRAGPICADSDRLQQVIWNLLSNSIKFTPAGGNVTVRLHRIDGQIEVSISDTGQGIAPSFLPHVFERFRQADATITRKHGGLGLGLAIVKQLVELHGGTVRASSEGEGKGSMFIVQLPLLPHPLITDEPHRPRAAMAEPAIDECASLAGVSILIVDDEPDSRRLIHRVLADCDAIVHVAGTASEAIELLRSHRPQVLISDISMPEVDGYRLLEQVRALGPDGGGNLPAIALTAFARAQDRDKALSAGFLSHLSKPFLPQKLVAVVASAVRKKTG